MTLQLPAHLANRQSRNIAAEASAGIGSSMPPHVSIRGNGFTLVDAAGNEAVIGNTLDIVVAASSGSPGPKRYYKEKWKPDSNEPPTCWSSNGVVPDPSGAIIQARTCAECPMNVRGSKTSEMSGVAIKACRDEKWLAILIPQYPSMLFQLMVTPGSFKNWSAYTKNFGAGVDLCDVITRVTFEPGVNGVLVFEILGYAQNNAQYVSADIRNVLEAAWVEKKTDALVGRNETPILLAPANPPTPGNSTVEPVPYTPAQPAGFALPQQQSPTPSVQQQPQFGTTGPSTAPAAAETSGQPTQRRRRRTAAEMQAAQPQMTLAAAPSGAPAMAPFMPQGQPAPTASPPPAQGNGAQFGVAAGAAPNPELATMLAGVFGKQ